MVINLHGLKSRFYISNGTKGLRYEPIDEDGFGPVGSGPHTDPVSSSEINTNRHGEDGQDEKPVPVSTAGSDVGVVDVVFDRT